MELTVKQMESLEYRKKRLMDRARQLELLLSGRGVSLLPMVRTKTGRHSEKRVWALVEKLLDALEKYEKYRRCGKKDGDTPLAAVDYKLPERKRAFYSSFLYCAIRVAESDPFWFRETKGIFDDILTLAEQTQYVTKTALHFDELYHGLEMDGFFGCMDELYQALSGKPITDTISEAERLAVREQYQAEVGEIETFWEEFDRELGMTAEEQRQVLQEYYESLSEEEQQQAEEEGAWERAREQEKQEWVQSFPGKETFCEQYLRCRELYFEVTDGRGLVHEVERMMDIYLCERGESSFLVDNAFFSAYALLTKIIKQLQELLRGEK